MLKGSQIQAHSFPCVPGFHSGPNVALPSTTFSPPSLGATLNHLRVLAKHPRLPAVSLRYEHKLLNPCKQACSGISEAPAVRESQGEQLHLPFEPKNSKWGVGSASGARQRGTKVPPSSRTRAQIAPRIRETAGGALGKRSETWTTMKQMEPGKSGPNNGRASVSLSRRRRGSPMPRRERSGRDGSK